MLRIGLIGCGYIANKHLNTIVRSSDISLTAVSDIQKEKMEEAVHLYQKNKGKPKQIALYENYGDMLNDSNIDAVVIAVISGLHAEIAKKALNHGKHIIIEKPLRSEEHTSELQSRGHLVCRLLLEKKKIDTKRIL